jgi:hypothetical protein
MDEPVEVDSPYKYSSKAKQLEDTGDVRHAEVEFKRAVTAADKLPLSEYKNHFSSGLAHEQVARQSAEDFENSQMVRSIPELERSYQELLALPFLTRIQLAGFYARNAAVPEARDVCEEALHLGLDELSCNNEALTSMLDRAKELLVNLNDIIGPEGAEELFLKNFEKLDRNKDGFVDERELKLAQLDLSLGADVQRVIRYLLYHYFDVERASNDEFGMDISGISRRDAKKYQQKSNGEWKRMHHPR